MERQVKVELEDESGEIVGVYFINKLNVAAQTKLSSLSAEILERDIDDAEKNQLCSCAALAVSVTEEDGKPLYDGDVDKIFNEMDYDVHAVLCAEYIQLNPVRGSLKAKKKKS